MGARFPDRPSGSCPVGFYDQKPTQPLGLEDMTGNVWTWTVSVGQEASDRVTVRDQHLGFRCAQAPL